MKKKIYFITSAIIQIILAATILLSVDQIVQSVLDLYTQMQAYMPSALSERMITLMQNNGGKFLVIITLINIAANIAILIMAIKDKLLKYKGYVISLSIASFISGVHTITSLLSIVNFIVILCCKRKNPEDFPIKKEIPKIEYEKSSIKEKILGIVLVILYFSQFLIRRSFFPDLSIQALLGIMLVVYLILLIVTILIFKDKYKKDFKLYKENSKAYFSFVVPRFVIMYIIFIAISLICLLITKQAVSTNQENLEKLPLWFSFLSAAFYAPVVEEAIFRGVFRRFIKNKVVFIAVSGIVFGLLHTLGLEENITKALIMSLPYITMGTFFAYIYAKTENIIPSTLCHMFNNIYVVLITSSTFFII